MKKLALLLTLTLTALSAHADLGDTIEQSIQRYGKPWRHTGNLYSFHSDDTFIILLDEWVNPANRKVEFIEYVTKGRISDEVYAKYCEKNLPPSLKEDASWHGVNKGSYHEVTNKDYYIQYSNRGTAIHYIALGLKSSLDQWSSEFKTYEQEN